MERLSLLSTMVSTPRSGSCLISNFAPYRQVAWLLNSFSLEVHGTSNGLMSKVKDCIQSLFHLC